MLNLLLDQSAQAAQTTGGFQNYSGIIMIVALIAIFYFFMIRPQQKRQKQIRQFRESLTKGSPVVTAGGIYGKITDVADKYFIVAIDDNTKIRVDKQSVYPSAEEANQKS